MFNLHKTRRTRALDIKYRLCKLLALSTGYVLTLKIVWPSQCPTITLLWVPITSPDPPNPLFFFFFHGWIFCSINPTDQVGFVNVLNFNTLGHLSLRPNPGSVSDQTSYFLIWFGSKVAQERAKGEVVVVMEWCGLGGGWRGFAAHHLMKSWCEGGRGGPGGGEEEGDGGGRGATPSKENDGPPERWLHSLIYVFSCFEGLVKSIKRCAPSFTVWDAASGTRRAPKWTRIELQVINLWKAPLWNVVCSHKHLSSFAKICTVTWEDRPSESWMESMFFSLVSENNQRGFSKTSCVLVELVVHTLSYCWKTKRFLGPFNS